MLTLYHQETSVCSSKVRFVLAEKKLDYKSRILDLGKGEQHDPEYLRMHPKGLVPTLVHDDKTIIESNVICEYLEDVFEENSLKPQDPFGKARMRMWTRQLDEDVHTMTSIISTAIAFRHLHLQAPPEVVEANFLKIKDRTRRNRSRDIIMNGLEADAVIDSTLRFAKLLSDMQATLGNSTWLAGETFSLADIALAPYITRLDHLQLQFMWEDYPSVNDWYKRIVKREAYVTSHSTWFETDFIVKLMKEKGQESAPFIKSILENKGAN
ncbi:MAG: hypothetical protein COA71_13025 [SAR86 cluster bacterium]|uniref:Glutathione S-transferase family protein n=1 Tax=SAR86 cluster bacterium TaxID=2030880 RepID=A0A2A5C7E6_9GAMM|nr:MAG: hypothetical protein COA71_13025 [SAR86 cluster bacterium]